MLLLRLPPKEGFVGDDFAVFKVSSITFPNTVTVRVSSEAAEAAEHFAVTLPM